ncbi:tetratricopeptide repeat protein [Candidatus Dependentiae bacterium]|nr:tetratricopeptide repeat protein [Candidatus Dependentiae bacterium]
MQLFLKKQWHILSLLSFYLVNLFSQPGELVVVIMIKNESEKILQTLQPYADGEITRMVVLDTGSTDDTITKVRSFFKKNSKITGYLFEQPFVNFAVSRNYAIECAERCFQDACFLFMPDAEWYMQNVKGLKQFCYDHAKELTASYLVKIRNDKCNFDFYVQRLFRAHKGIRFKGAVHETIFPSTNAKVPDNIYISWDPSDSGNKKSQQRWHRDKNLLLQELEQNPNDTRATFYLAQTYSGLEDTQNAILYYKKRCEMTDDWSEETFIANYRLGVIYEQIKDWDNALHYFLKAYNMRPHRAEPLVHLASYYCTQKQFALAFLFAFAAAGISYPETDILFIEKELYDYTRYDILSCVAFYMHQYQIGKDATLEALKVRPGSPHLAKNLSIYNSTLAKLGNQPRTSTRRR